MAHASFLGLALWGELPEACAGAQPAAELAWQAFTPASPGRAWALP